MSTSAETAASSTTGGAAASLASRLTAPEQRRRVIADCCQLIDEEVSRKGGFSGAAIKLGYATVKAVKPGFIAELSTTCSTTSCVAYRAVLSGPRAAP